MNVKQLICQDNMLKNALALLFLCLLPCLSQKPQKCDTCREFAKHFNKGLDKTARSNFGGGNTNWEEKNLGSYAGSETRLLEILEYACGESEKKECHYMIEEHEELLEDWWFQHYNKGIDRDIFIYFCDQTLKVCCPNGTFGPSCLDCPGGRSNPCSGHGECKGAGSRTGTGSCSCNAGYEGDVCEDCSESSFQEIGDDGNSVCTKCHTACKSSCTSALASGCEDCGEGWESRDGQGCFDVDECKSNDVTCPTDRYCSNNDGSYRCNECHKACSGCTGPSNNECITCSTKHFLQGSTCTACHVSCKSSCSDVTPFSCDSCDEGWKSGDDGCVDRDECEEGIHGCDKENEYCSNTQGSFQCLACHNTCRSCMGPEKSHCLGCKLGYHIGESGFCEDVDECIAGDVCPDENEHCVNTVGSYTCECVEGYVRRMGSPCFKKHVVSNLKKKKTKTVEKDRPSDLGDRNPMYDELPGENGFTKKKKVPTATLR